MIEEDLMVLNKLNYLHDIRLMVNDIRNLQCRVREEIDVINLEDRCLQEFKREMESLNQEKMTHVEELRQIHSDINMLDNVLKQSEEDRNRRVDNVKQHINQIQQLKGKMDKMCTDVELPPRQCEIEEEPFYLNDKRFFLNNKPGTESVLDPVRGNIADSQPLKSASSVATINGANANTNTNTNASLGSSSFSSSLASLMSGFQDKHQSPYGRMLLSSANAQGAATGNGTTFQEQSSSSTASAPSAFRQQPPPMKSCGSCHQQIHRNAPICPLCKAKSRSRHPKRRNNANKHH